MNTHHVPKLWYRQRWKLAAMLILVYVSCVYSSSWTIKVTGIRGEIPRGTENEGEKGSGEIPREIQG